MSLEGLDIDKMEKKEQLKDIQPCEDLSDCVELSRTSGLYLKPVAKLSITVTLPQLKSGQSVSNWEVMEKLRAAIQPDFFTVIKVTKSTLDFIRFDAEIDNKKNVPNIVKKIDMKGIKLSGFSDLLKIRATEAKVPFPTKHEWDSFFRDAKHMNEMKPGERPDTVHLQDIPCRWFAHLNDVTASKPSEFVVRKVFESFGEIRAIDIPILDSYRKKMSPSISGIKNFTYNNNLLFESFIQYKEYIGFAKCMHALQGKKLVFMEDGKAWSINIKVDFDKTRHLSELFIKKRQAEREKLMEEERKVAEKLKKEKELLELKKEMERQKQEDERKRKKEEKRAKKEEKLLRKKSKLEAKKERKQKKREEKFKRAKEAEEEKLSKKIAQEERKLLIAQRKLEAIQIFDELFERIKVLRQKEITKTREEELFKHIDEQNKKKLRELKKKEAEEQKKLELLNVKEKELRDKLIRSIKFREEERMEFQRERLRRAVQGKVKLDSVVDQSASAENLSISSVASSSDEMDSSSDVESSSLSSSHHSKASSRSSSAVSVKRSKEHTEKDYSDAEAGDNYTSKRQKKDFSSSPRYRQRNHPDHYYPSYYQGYDDREWKDNKNRDNRDYYNNWNRGRGMRGNWRFRGFQNRGRGFYDRGRGFRNKWSYQKHGDGGDKRDTSWFSRDKGHYSRSRSRSRRSRSYSRSSRSSRSRSYSKTKDYSSRSRSPSRSRNTESENAPKVKNQNETVEIKRSRSKSHSRSRKSSSREHSDHRSRSRAKSSPRQSRSTSRAKSRQSRSRSHSRGHSDRKSYSRERGSRSRSRSRSKRDERSHSRDRKYYSSDEEYYRRKHKSDRGHYGSDVEFSSDPEDRYHHKHRDGHYDYRKSPRGFRPYNNRRGFRGRWQPRGWRGPFRGRGYYNNRPDQYHHHHHHDRYRDDHYKDYKDDHYKDYKDDHYKDYKDKHSPGGYEEDQAMEQYRDLYKKYFDSLAEREAQERERTKEREYEKDREEKINSKYKNDRPSRSPAGSDRSYGPNARSMSDEDIHRKEEGNKKRRRSYSSDGSAVGNDKSYRTSSGKKKRVSSLDNTIDVELERHGSYSDKRYDKEMMDKHSPVRISEESNKFSKIKESGQLYSDRQEKDVKERLSLGRNRGFQKNIRQHSGNYSEDSYEQEQGGYGYEGKDKRMGGAFDRRKKYGSDDGEGDRRLGFMERMKRKNDIIERRLRDVSDDERGSSPPVKNKAMHDSGDDMDEGPYNRKSDAIERRMRYLSDEDRPYHGGFKRGGGRGYYNHRGRGRGYNNYQDNYHRNRGRNYS